MSSEVDRQMVHVRPATAEDIAFMVQLFIELARQRDTSGVDMDVEAITQGTRQATLEQVQGKIAKSVTYVIEAAGRPVGRLRVVRADDQVFIGGIQILPSDQNQGIGSVVIDQIIDEATARSLPVVLEVDKDNPRAERLYERLGFCRCGETELTYPMRYLAH